MRAAGASPNSLTSTSLLDVESVARLLGVTPRFVRRLVADRRIPFVKIGKFVRFDLAELNGWLDRQRVTVEHRGTVGRIGRR